MRAVIAACFFLALCPHFNFASAPNSGKFLVVAPRRLFAGKYEKLWVTFTDIEQNKKSSLTINLLHPEDSNIVLSTVNLKQSDKNVKTAILEVPVTELTRATLEVVGGSESDKDRHRVEVEIEHSDVLTFIETDRPFYKPGELVRMRFLMLQHKLVPFTGVINKIWVESPSEVRMAQWQDVETSFGITQLELQLSEEPVEGMWKIKLHANNVSTIVTKSFEVKEYVLPKYEVTITPPDYITDTSTDLSWKVCAKYSYGKPVQGNIKFNFTFENPFFHWYGRSKNSEHLHVISREEKLHKKDGCHKFHLTQEEFAAQQEKHSINIKVKAVVEEIGTNEVQEATHKSSIHRTEITMDFNTSPPYFRPYLPYHGRVRVTLRNGKPVGDQEVKLTIKFKKTSHSPWTHTWNLPNHDRKNFTTDANGYINFVIPPQTKEVHTIFIEAATKVSPQNIDIHESFEAKQWYSPTDSYIQIVDHHAMPLKCGSLQSLEVQYTYTKNVTKSVQFFYLLQSKGEILNQVAITEAVRDAKLRQEIRGSNATIGKFPGQDKLIPVGKWHLKLNVTAMMAPMSQLLVYHIREDGETVAASHKLNIRPCLHHKVSTSFLHDQTQPGGKAYLSITPSSRSLCAITGVDKAVTFLSGDHALTQDKVFEQLKRFDIRAAPPDHRSFQPCYADGGAGGVLFPDEWPVPMPLAGVRGKRSIMLPSNSGFGNTKKAFRDAGMVVLSNLGVDPSPCSPDDPERPCNPCPQFRKYARILLKDNQDEISARGMDMQVMRAVPMVQTISKNSDGMDESLTYNSNVIDSPAIEMRSVFPETWLWQLELFDDSLERTFELETPHTITDWIVNTMCVSAVDGLGIAPPTSIRVFKPYFMDFTLPYSVKRGEILPLKVSLFNYLNHALPIRLTFGEFSGGELLNEISHTACLEEHNSLVHEFRLNPTALGEHNISVTANVDEEYPLPCGPEIIINARDGLTKKIIVKPEGFPEEGTTSIFVCLADTGEEATFSWDLDIPENVVPESARAYVSVIGDIMGPSLENLDGLVQLPMGCGEQNMILFVPNIVVLNYLNSSGQANPQLQANALSNMKKGYQRELTYRHKDGSYSAFGEHDPEGSMWLTAFVVKSFAQAKKFTFVDEKDLQLSVDWITKKQLENGCFPFVGQVFHKDMKGGLDGNESPTALSAYILISLLETGLELNNNIVSNGVYCLLGEKNPDLYTLTLTTYALTLISERQKNSNTRNKAEEYLARVIALAKMDKENEMWWEKSGSKSLSLSVEMTAYNILTLSKLGGEESLFQALNAVRWISKHRNANGGFVSTQDTVVALEAIATYAVSIPSYDVNMKLLGSSTENWSHEFSLKPETRLVLQQVTLTSVPTTLTFHVQGTGCSLIQSNLRYSVKSAPISEAFNLSSSLTPVIKNTCSQLLLDVNLAYNLPDNASNMAVLEVELLSGYIPVKQSLNQLMSNSAVNLKRWDENSGKVNLYFDSITNVGVNLNFLIEQAVEVESPQPAEIKVYDYYEQELIVVKSYGLEEITCIREMLPEPVPIDEPVLEVIDPIKTDQATFVSAESEFSDQPPRKDDPFEKFSNVDHELAVPDGIEGVEPIRVPAPPLTGQHIHIRDVSGTVMPGVSMCPTCYDKVPIDFSQMYCSSVSAYKISTRSTKTAKLLTDVSPSKKSTKVNKYVSLVIDKSCKCGLLSKEGNQAIILLPSSQSTLSESTKPTMNLKQARVIHIMASRGTPTLINQARKFC